MLVVGQSQTLTTVEQLQQFGASLMPLMRSQRLLELVGDVGVGKTTLTQGLARALGVTYPLTSPSFTISKRYPLAAGQELVHYDLYRLPDPGLMTSEILETIQDGHLVVLEWAQSMNDLLPTDRLIFTLSLLDTGARLITRTA